MRRKKSPAAPSPTRRPQKAYYNRGFLAAPDARLIRVLAEYLEPSARFRDLKIRDTIVFFGSARSLPLDVANQRYAELEARLAQLPRIGRKERIEREMGILSLRMAEYYEKARELARKLTEWSIKLPGPDKRFVICSGGGPGMMEAANRGASDAGGISIGLNISLPFEQEPNPYIPQDLAFEFHYFFMRKFWFAYLARAMVIFPGGFGTMDEMMELLTLVQTRKLKKRLPIVLYGTEYWDDVINWEKFVRWGMISREDLNLFKRIDDVDEIFEYLTAELKRLYL